MATRDAWAQQRVQASASFREWRRKGGGRHHPHLEVIRAGESSDDTQLTLAVARARVVGGSSWWQYLVRNELPLWTLYQRGGGVATRRAAASWMRGVPPWRQRNPEEVERYLQAGGNGVASRVLPHAIHFAAEDDPNSLLRDVLLDGASTHGHPRALVGASAYAYAAWVSLRSRQALRFGELLEVLLDSSSIWGARPPPGSAWFELHGSPAVHETQWQAVVDEQRRMLHLGRQALSAGALADDLVALTRLGVFGRDRGAGTVCAAAAIYLAARYAAQPLQGVLRAAFAPGSDTSTLAALTAGLLSAIAGSDWLPEEWRSVQDAEYLRGLASRLAVPGDAGSLPDRLSVIAKDLDAIVGWLTSGTRDSHSFGRARSARVMRLHELTPLSPSVSVAGWQLQLSDGQVVYVKHVRRKAKDVPTFTGRAGVDGTHRGASRAGGVKLIVRELPASVAFYERLGLLPEKIGKKFVSFGAISLVESTEASDLTASAVTDAPSPRNRVEVLVADLDSIHAHAVTGGLSPERVLSQSWGARSFLCVDPDGNIVEVIENRALYRS